MQRICMCYMDILHLLHMDLETPCLSCSVFACVTWISYTFMITLPMDLQTPYLSCSVFAFVTKRSHTFKFALNVNLPVTCSMFAFITWTSPSSIVSLFFICALELPAEYAAYLHLLQG